MALELAKITKQINTFTQMTPRSVMEGIRWDKETNQGSILDVISLLTGFESNNSSKVLERLKVAHPEVATKCRNLKFPGKGQKNTAVANTATLVELAFLCPGKVASQFRRQGAETLCRHLAGDLSLGNKAQIFV